MAGSPREWPDVELYCLTGHRVLEVGVWGDVDWESASVLEDSVWVLYAGGKVNVDGSPVSNTT